MSKFASSKLPVLSMIGAMLIFTSFAVLARELNYYFSAVQQLSVRLTVAGIIALGVCLISGKNFSGLRNIGFWKFNFYVVMTPVFILLYIYSINKTDLLTAIVAFYSFGLITSLTIGHLVFKDSLSRMHLVSIAVCLLGVLIYGWPISDSWSQSGFVFGVLAGIADAVNNGTKRMVKGKADIVVLAVPTLLISGVFLFCVEWARGSSWKFSTLDTSQTWQAAGWVAVYSILMVLVAYLTLYGYGNLGMARATVIVVAEIPLVGILGWIIYDEKPSLLQIAGGMVVFFSFALSVISPSKAEQAAISNIQSRRLD